MIKNWVNYATNGDPGMPWTPMGPEENQKFTFWNILSANPEMTYREDIKERMDLWDKIMTNDYQIRMNGCTSNRQFLFQYLPFLFALIRNVFQFRSIQIY